MPLRRAGHRHHAEAGSITLMVVVVALALVAMVGLVVDGRAQMTAQQRADNVAAEAARAAGQEINGAVVSGSRGIDRARALAAARSHLAAAGVRGSVAVRGDTIVVRTGATEPARILSLVGVTALEATGHATVRIMTGLERPGR
ncbi:hypothetical protein CLV30_104162 [Haloactinopolyspora alba]|uniref:Putative Flp pilus-assembly TadG-like N-terminal domain-containing protein n=1 Tax=Haloactinopolyspora alba TaxID=648780 RepID=A0A2P8E759_9ACTN|nr:pilus assembly protein TadG-related protein [Haloactinopolyspora alba]PSL05296.1 hypothetical protein CLV30_104162 [Haloactinopolyspora alba]